MASFKAMKLGPPAIQLDCGFRSRRLAFMLRHLSA